MKLFEVRAQAEKVRVSRQNINMHSTQRLLLWVADWVCFSFLLGKVGMFSPITVAMRKCNIPQQVSVWNTVKTQE